MFYSSGAVLSCRIILNFDLKKFTIKLKIEKQNMTFIRANNLYRAERNNKIYFSKNECSVRQAHKKKLDYLIIVIQITMVVFTLENQIYCF